MAAESNSQIQIRDSNIELMRIIIMFFIVFLHYITNAELLTDTTPSTTFLGVNTIRGFLLVAVNCFILTSGYYGIKISIRGGVKFYLTVLIYSTLAYFIHLITDGQTIGRSVLYNTVFCISHSKLWFAQCYFGLFLLSPILNYAVNGMGKKEYIFVLSILTVMNVYFGWFWHDSYFANTNGFTIANMVYVYFIGGYIRRFISQDALDKRRNTSLTIYIVATILSGIISWRLRDIPTYHWQTNAYNNPLILISSVAFFCFFNSFHFKCPKINFLAKGTFAVYLVHEGAYFRNWFKEACQWLCGFESINSSTIICLITLALFAAITVLIIAIIDSLRQRITDKLVILIPNKK